jgi:protein phosphatase
MQPTYHILGDVHGNLAQLRDLLRQLGYTQPDPVGDPHLWLAPEGCLLVSVGDLVDRGPDSVGCLRTLLRMVQREQALLVVGNHEWRFRHMLRYELALEEDLGRVSPARLMSYVQILGLTESEKQELLAFLDAAPLYLELADGELLVTHARWERGFRQLEGDALVRACAFGDAKGEDPDTGDLHLEDVPELPDAPLVELPSNVALPDRARWTRAWGGPAEVVWGHQMVLPNRVVRIGRTVNVESGCFMGHALSAYVYPQRQVVQVRGSTHWKRDLKRFDRASEIVFPRALADVVRVVRDHKLRTFEDYVAWLELEFKRCGIKETASPETVATHEALFKRAAEVIAGE